ncbi:uncharacterized protein LOC34619202 [Cyclospora cayetanensis]|uniref:Uncharacterized protein LOC34619202 n=1 Tax=Cyclospora cayetanensis TaxID=88456 RepID=A0A6P6RQC3_9EIME|nr:uncharacterized protein LOC34619202 [Cyclospora cayetanensis]
MGKRKSTSIKPKPNRIPKLDKEFNCPFCNSSTAVKVELRAVSRLEEGIDVYGDWIDACVAANAAAAKEAQLKLERGSQLPQGGASRGPPSAATESPSDSEAATRGKEKIERQGTPRRGGFQGSGGARKVSSAQRGSTKKLARSTESEAEGSSSEETEGVDPEGDEGSPSLKRLRVDRGREGEEGGEAVGSEGSDTEGLHPAEQGGDAGERVRAREKGEAEIGGVLEQYRRDAEGEEEDSTALFNDDE